MQRFGAIHKAPAFPGPTQAPIVTLHFLGVSGPSTASRPFWSADCHFAGKLSLELSMSAAWVRLEAIALEEECAKGCTAAKERRLTKRKTSNQAS